MKRNSRSRRRFDEQEVINSESESLDAEDNQILEDAGFNLEDTKHMPYEEKKNLLNAILESSKCLDSSHSEHHKEAISVEDENEEVETQPIEVLSVDPSPKNDSDDEIDFKDNIPEPRRHPDSSEPAEVVSIASPQGSSDEEETQPYESPKISRHFTQSPTVVPESQSIQSSPASVIMMSDNHDFDIESEPKPRLNLRVDSVFNPKHLLHENTLNRTYPKQNRTNTSLLWTSLNCAQNLQNPEHRAQVFELVYDIYFRRLKRAKQNIKGKVVAFGKPVTTGAHVEGCLIAKDKKTNLTLHIKVNNKDATSDFEGDQPDDPRSKKSRADSEERPFKESGVKTGDPRKDSRTLEKKIQPEKTSAVKKSISYVIEEDNRVMSSTEDDEPSESDDDSDYKPKQKHSARQRGRLVGKKRKAGIRQTGSKTSQVKKLKLSGIKEDETQPPNPGKQLKLGHNITPERESEQDNECAATKYKWSDDELETNSNTNSQPVAFQTYENTDDSSNNKENAESSGKSSVDEDASEVKANVPLTSDTTSAQRNSPGFNSQSSNSLLDVNGDLYSTQITRHSKKASARPLPTELDGPTTNEYAANINLQEQSERDGKHNDGCAIEKRMLRKRIREETEKDFDYFPADEDRKAELSNSLNLFRYEDHETNINSKRRKEAKRHPKVNPINLSVASTSQASRELSNEHSTQDSLPLDVGTAERETRLRTKTNKLMLPSSSKNPSPEKEILDSEQPCPVCGETFSMASLEKHASTCGEDIQSKSEEITNCVHCQCEFHIEHIKEHQIKCSKITKVGTPKRLTRSLKAGTTQVSRVEKMTESSNEPEEWVDLLAEK